MRIGIGFFTGLAVALFGTGYGHAQTCTTPPAGLVSSWPGEGNATDVVSGNNGTVVGAVTFGPGEVGNGFQLDGASYLWVPPNASLTPQAGITVDAWIRLSPGGSYENYPPIVKNSGTPSSVNAGYSLELGGLDVGFWVFVSGNWYAGGLIPVPLDIWTHVAGVYDGTYVKLYLNGVQAGAASYAPGVIEPGTLGLNIGHDPAVAQGDGDRFFTGAIDEVDIFDRALTDSEILAIYAAGSAGKCSAPVPPTVQIQNLVTSTLMTNLSANIQNQLDAKLTSIIATLDAARTNSTRTAANQLQAFVNSVEADLHSGRLGCAQAESLVAAAQRIATGLGRPPLSVSMKCP